jgi:hypothetical protein
MGRKKIYKTEAEKKQANRLKARKYYLKNAEKIKKRRMEKYYEEKKVSNL